MKICVDVDGTITDGSAVRAAIVAYAESIGISPNLNIYNYGLSHYQMSTFLDLYITQALENESIRPACATTMMDWYRAGDSIYILTARDSKHHVLTATWLSKHGVPHNAILHNSDKALISAMLAADCIIEDNASNALECASAGIATLLLDASYNRDICDGMHLRRVYTWDDIARTVERLRYGEGL